MKYKLRVCREVWGTVEIEAASTDEAIAKFDDGDYDGGFTPNGKIGNESAYAIEEVSE